MGSRKPGSVAGRREGLLGLRLTSVALLPWPPPLPLFSLALSWLQDLSLPISSLSLCPSYSPSPYSPFSALSLSLIFFVFPLSSFLFCVLPFPCLPPSLPISPTSHTLSVSRSLSPHHPAVLSLSVPTPLLPSQVTRIGWLPAQDWEGLSYKGPVGPGGGAEETLWGRGRQPASGAWHEL